MPENKKAKIPNNPVITGYLIGYNAIQFLGWSYILIVTLNHLIKHQTHVGVWEDVQLWLKIFQTAAILEIIHGLIRIVQTNPIMAFLQIFSRVLVVWGIANISVEAQESVGLPLLLFTWTITEMVRYSFYCLNLISLVPYFLIWCRYTFFFVLYPMGVTGEIICMFSAMPFIKQSGIFSIDLPNEANISFSYYNFIIFVMLSYIPVFPQLYFHMISQRKKVLNPKKKD